MSRGIFIAVWIIGFILITILLAIFTSGCSILQPRPDTITTPPTPSGQLWHTVKKSNWLVTLAIPIIALGAVAMFNGAAKLGMSAIIFGAVNLFMALATARFALWMGVFGLIGSGLAVAASILSKNKALKEIICGTQELKKKVALPDGRDGANSVLRENQSKPTQRIVQNIKTKLKLEGEI